MTIATCGGESFEKGIWKGFPMKATTSIQHAVDLWGLLIKVGEWEWPMAIASREGAASPSPILGEE